jgi:hypothetical protein
MPEFWNYIKNLFKTAEDSSPSNPVVHELIQRTEEEKADYDHWKETLVRRRLTDWLIDQYAIYQVLPHDIDEALDFLDTPSSKGFVVHFNQTRYSVRDVTHFFDYLKERVRALNYRTQISDTRTYHRADWVETVQRHYLKPRPNFQEGEKMDQAYGNVMIELELRNERVQNLRFRATSYQDRLFNDALEFKALMQEVLA